jgi:acetolactate synthase-1/2/3 large subunit
VVRDLIHRYLQNRISRRNLLDGLARLGFTGAASAILDPLEASENAKETTNDTAPTTAGNESVEGTAGELLVAQAKAAGIQYVFANPGSVETQFYDAIIDSPGIQVIMGLHEGIVVSMADGYHRVTQQPALVNVHSYPGTATALGQLANATRDGSALVVTAGFVDNEIWSDDYYMSPPPGVHQKDLVNAFTKISWEGREAASVPLMLRRALQTAVTEPGGPVYLALNLWSDYTQKAQAQILPAERFMFRNRLRPPASEIERVARLLIESKRPLAILGDGITKSGADAEVIQLSNKIGIAMTPGFVESFINEPEHPHTVDFGVGTEMGKRGTDLILMIGCSQDLGGPRLPKPGDFSSLIPATTKIVRIGMNASSMGRTHPSDVALLGDVRATLRELLSALDGLATKERLAAIASKRSEDLRSISSAEAKEGADYRRQQRGKDPMHASEISEVLNRLLDSDAIIVDEFSRALPDQAHRLRMQAGGVSLGWGVGAATGAKIAAVDRQVVCLVGDGSLMFGPAAFWTQARYNIPVLTIVSNNRNYETLRLNYNKFGGRMAKSDHYPVYLGDPDIDFVKLAESQGVKGARVERPSGLEAALKKGIEVTRAGEPYLLELPIAREGGGAASMWHDGFNLASKRKRLV